MEHELHLAKVYEEFVSFLEDLLEENFKIKIPKGVIPRAIYDVASQDLRSFDPRVLKKEIMDDLPCKYILPRYVNKSNVKRSWDTVVCASKQFRNVLSHDTIKFLDSKRYVTPEMYESLIENLKVDMERNFGDCILEMTSNLLIWLNLRMKEPSIIPASSIQIDFQDDIVKITGYGYSFELYRERYERLRKRHGRNDSYTNNLFAMLLRYKILFGRQDESVGLHGSILDEVFEVLKKYGVNTECFASPLNFSLEYYHSAFPDVDTPFGSLGSFFDANFASGSYEANPPFSEGIMNAMAEKFYKSLEDATEKLAFYIFVPRWEHPPLDAVENMMKSKWAKFRIVGPKDHRYISGNRHGPSKKYKTKFYQPPHASCLIVLANYEVKDSVLDEIVQAWK